MVEILMLVFLARWERFSGSGSPDKLDRVKARTLPVEDHGRSHVRSR
jgi:hypothetical protein